MITLRAWRVKNCYYTKRPRDALHKMPNFLFPTISPELAVVKPSGPNQSLGTLSNDGSENVTKKNEFEFFQT